MRGLVGGGISIIMVGLWVVFQYYKGFCSIFFLNLSIWGKLYYYKDGGRDVSVI